MRMVDFVPVNEVQAFRSTTLARLSSNARKFSFRDRVHLTITAALARRAAYDVHAIEGIMRGSAAARGPAAHEGSMRKFAIIVLILTAVAVIWYRWEFPTASYRYRLTVAVNADGQVHTGSSVIDVSYRFYPHWFSALASGSQFDSKIRGQAALIDLGKHGVLVAALFGQPGDYSTQDADALAGRAFLAFSADAPGFPVTLENIRAISRMRGLVDLGSNDMPPFIWFSNKADPAAAHFVKPDEFAAVIGDSVRLAFVQLQITDDPIVVDIDRKLPLYRALPPPPLLVQPGKFAVNWAMFVAPGSVP